MASTTRLVSLKSVSTLTPLVSSSTFACRQADTSRLLSPLLSLFSVSSVPSGSATLVERPQPHTLLTTSSGRNTRRSSFTASHLSVRRRRNATTVAPRTSSCLASSRPRVIPSSSFCVGEDLALLTNSLSPGPVWSADVSFSSACRSLPLHNQATLCRHDFLQRYRLGYLAVVCHHR